MSLQHSIGELRSPIYIYRDIAGIYAAYGDLPGATNTGGQLRPKSFFLMDVVWGESGSRNLGKQGDAPSGISNESRFQYSPELRRDFL